MAISVPDKKNLRTLHYKNFKIKTWQWVHGDYYGWEARDNLNVHNWNGEEGFGSRTRKVALKKAKKWINSEGVDAR